MVLHRLRVDGVGEFLWPPIPMTVGSLFLPDTPNSIIQRGHEEEAQKMLQKIRGTEHVDQEFQDLVDAS